jgi:putative ABC transport system ATP-binding protein
VVPALELAGVSMEFGREPNTVTALDDVSLQIRPGSFTAVMGPSGSGKSTFLHCAAGLERPSAGAVAIAGTALAGLRDEQLTRFRRHHVGFVFQSFHLLPYLTAYQNVEMPLRLTGGSRGRIDPDRIRAALAEVGLLERAGHYPAQLSGGQQQRVAVARALITRPAVIFADEPTGALDSSAARELLVLLQSAARARQQTIVMVTHDPVAAAHADAVVFLVDGAIHAQMQHPTAEAVAAQMTRLSDGPVAVGAGR